MVEIPWHRQETRRQQRKQTSTYSIGRNLPTRHIGTAVATGASLGSGVVQGYSLDGNRSQLVSQTATTSGTQSMNRAYGALHRVLMWVGSSEITRLHNDFTRVLYCWSFGVVDCADI